MPCNLSTIQSEACTSGIGKIQDPVKLLQLIAQLTCEASEGGGGAVWGQITGTLADQTDLQAALDARNPLWVRAQNTAVSVTGTLVETVLWSITIPGGTIGTNGWAEIHFMASANNDASAKTLKWRLGGVAGTEVAIGMNLASVLSSNGVRYFACRNSNTAKISTPITGGASPTPWFSSGSGLYTYNFDTSGDVTFVITGTLADAADTLTLEAAMIRIFYRP